MLKVLARKIGLTENEFKVLIFFATLYLGGLFIKSFFGNSDTQQAFDYSETDNLYDSLNNLPYDESAFNEKLKKESDQTSQKSIEKSPKSDKVEPKQKLKEQSIGINSAGIEEFMKLPGIGKKTAENIIEYRNKIGAFQSVEELLNVKGIGKSRLENIKKYIYIDAPKLKR